MAAKILETVVPILNEIKKLVAENADALAQQRILLSAEIATGLENIEKKIDTIKSSTTKKTPVKGKGATVKTAKKHFSTNKVLITAKLKENDDEFEKLLTTAWLKAATDLAKEEGVEFDIKNRDEKNITNLSDILWRSVRNNKSLKGDLSALTDYKKKCNAEVAKEAEEPQLKKE